MRVNIQVRTEMNGSAQQGGRNPSTRRQDQEVEHENVNVTQTDNWSLATGEDAHDNVHICPLDGCLKAGVGANNTDSEVAVGADQD